ncbi:MAG: iron ABC transporter permease [Planctomycetia bacterium]|nr:iron ABC transporter permease [Planctomycetia bacterium]
MRVLIFLILLFFATIFVAPFIGPNAGEAQVWVFWQLRVPRILCALAAGGALAVCGAVFQAVFRNPLATPFTLGTASGAALGVSLLIFLAPGAGAFLTFFPAVSPLVLAAFSGALLSLSMIFAIVRFSRRTTDSDMLLAGVAVSFLYSSLIMLLQYLSDPTQTVRMLRWTMGGLERGGGYIPILTILPWVLPAFGILFWFHRELDLFCMGTELAHARGVATARTRTILLVTVSLLTAAVVSVCGPISFIGLMIPHIIRKWTGTRHRILLPASFLAGATLLVTCDTVARTIIFPDEIPVGIFTALLGGPFFLAQVMFRK